jgi:hypothetical protein
MKANEFDERFDNGQDMAAALDTTRARRPGVTRQSLIKVWIAEKLDHGGPTAT